MDPQATYDALLSLTNGLRPIGAIIEITIAAAAVIVALVTVLVSAERPRRTALWTLTGLLVAGECVTVWFHWQLARIMVVVDPASGLVSGHVIPGVWLESEKLYLWALLVAVMGVLMRRQRAELITGVTLSASTVA